MLERLLRSNAEVAVLGTVLFYDGLHLREIARRSGVTPPEAKRELDILVLSGILVKTAKGNMSIYTLNNACPFIEELRRLYLKTEGPIPLLKDKLSSIVGLNYAFVYGSFASGNFSESSDIDLFLVGDITEEDVDIVCFDVQKKTQREINYISWSNSDLRKKAMEGSAFMSSLLKKEKIWLVGDKNGFKRDAKKA